MNQNTMFEQYLKLEKKLHELRVVNGDVDSPEEDALLDEMDDVWYKLTEEDIRRLDGRTR